MRKQIKMPNLIENKSVVRFGDNDYLYVRHINDGIKSVISRIYDGEIQENKIYKVVHSGNTYHIEDVKMTN